MYVAYYRNILIGENCPMEIMKRAFEKSGEEREELECYALRQINNLAGILKEHNYPFVRGDRDGYESVKEVVEHLARTTMERFRRAYLNDEYINDPYLNGDLEARCDKFKMRDVVAPETPETIKSRGGGRWFKKS
jgi:hypothetical protein